MSERDQNLAPLCTIDDARNLASYFIGQYLQMCRAVTNDDALKCIEVLVSETARVKSGVEELIAKATQEAASAKEAIPELIRAPQA
jgi:hypothetical protein